MARLILDKVHVLGTAANGEEAVVGTNLYKAFQNKGDTFIAQNGHWYTLGGEEVEEAGVPPWVWEECRAMASEHRGLYRITLPEEREAGKAIPTVEEAPEHPSREEIMRALLKLNPDDDRHWTTDGRPALSVLKDYAGGVYVTRDRVNQVAPNFVRPGRT